MIVVVGRPGLTDDGRLDRAAALIAVAAAESGGSVELVGSVGDDADGDEVVVQLGRAGIGHAAVLRDPAGVTPQNVAADSPLPRLDAADIELALRYLANCQVLVVAEPIPADAMSAVMEAAAYHRAALVVLTSAGSEPDGPALPDGLALPAEATVLEMPAADDGAFAALVARYAVMLDEGHPPSEAWREAIDETGWEQAEE